MDLAQIAQSIEKLYSTHDSGEIKSLHSFLLDLQRQDDGTLARSLLMLESTNCQYFGALTYSVLLYNTREFPTEKLPQLIQEFVVFIADEKFNSLVLKKLLSNYATLFIYNYSNFPQNPIETLLYQLTGSGDLAFEKLNQRSFSILLDFYTIMVEEMIKKEQATQLHEVIYNQVYPFVYSTYKHLNSCLIGSIPYEVHILSLNCVNSWVSYISMSETQSQIRYQDTEELLVYLFNFLVNLLLGDTQSMDLINKSITAISEILEINPTMLGAERKRHLKSMLFEEGNFGYRFINQIAFNADMADEFLDELTNFVNFMVIFLLNEMISISRNITLPENQYILNLALRFTNFPGYPRIDEDISDQFLSFWEEFFNVFIDDEDAIELILEKHDQNTKDAFYSARNSICNEVCKVYWKKLILPPPEKLIQNRSEFMYYKSNVGDFFSTIYSLLKLPFYKDMVDLATSELKSNELNLGELESTLYILYKVNEDSTFYESQSNLLLPFTNNLMEGGLLNVLNGISPSTPNHYLVISTIINYIASIQFYLKTEYGPNYLGTILDFLFSIIIKSNDSKLSLISSKTILSICQECRSNLVVFLKTLKSLLDEMIQNQHIDNLIRTRMANSYVSIAQSAYLKQPQEFSALLLDLFSVIETNATKLMQNQQLDENMEDYLLSLLSCVNETGKACALPDEVDEIYTEQEAEMVSNFWNEDPNHIKLAIINIVKRFSIDFIPFTRKSTVTEVCCQIFRDGLNEPLNNPFKIDISLIFEYLALRVQSCDSNSLYHIFKLLETIVITNFKLLNETFLRQIIEQIFMPHFQSIENMDPDVIASSIDVFTGILDKRPSLLLQGNVDLFREVLLHNTEIFQFNESLVIKSLLKFWNSLITLKKGSQQDQTLVRAILIDENLGQILLNKLILSFLKNPRSSLDYYYLIFRNLVSKYQLQVKSWFDIALSGLEIKHVSDEDKKKFLVKLLVTRGQRLANEVLKRFWLQSNGLVEFNNKSY